MTASEFEIQKKILLFAQQPVVEQPLLQPPVAQQPVSSTVIAKTKPSKRGKMTPLRGIFILSLSVFVIICVGYLIYQLFFSPQTNKPEAFSSNESQNGVVSGQNTQALFPMNAVDDDNVGTTTLAGKYPANEFGLCDMGGNIWERCLNEWDNAYL